MARGARRRPGRRRRSGLEEHARRRRDAARPRRSRGCSRPARLDVAYPGVWLRDDVYATHGHYLDRHSRSRASSASPRARSAACSATAVDDISAPDDYEVVLAPLYALLDAIAARAPDGRGPSHANASTRAWRALDRRRPPAAAPRAARRGVPARHRRAQPRGRRPGARRPVRRRAAPRGPAGDGRRRRRACGIDAAPRDLRPHPPRRPAGRATTPPTGRCRAAARLCNSGLAGSSSRAWTRDGPASPYWPGGAVEIGGDGAPRHVRLLDDVPARGSSRAVNARATRRAAPARARSRRRGTRRRRRPRGRARPPCSPGASTSS